VTNVPGSNAVGHGRRDGTAGAVTAVVTAAVLISDVDDIGCAAKELTGIVVSSSVAAGSGSASTFTSAASTLLSGVDVLAASTVVGSSLGLGFLVGSAFSSSSFFDSELVWAPPVLTTSPGGACDVVDPVEVDGVCSEPFVCSAAVAVVPLSACVESASVVEDVEDSDVDDVDDDSVDDDSEDNEPGVSAHATGNPYPVTTAAPTPRATAKPPTRPT
jgi:hypothetical protein